MDRSGIQDVYRALTRAVVAPFCCDNRSANAHINIQLQNEGAQVW